MDRSDLNVILKNVADALRLDEDNRFQEAYGKYVECMMSIGNKLWHSFCLSGNDILARTVLNRYVKLGQQCMERISIILDKIDGSPVQPSPPSKSIQKSNIIISDENLAPLSRLQDSSINTFTRPKDTSPMEMAQKRNHQLMFAYKARMAQKNQGRKQHDLTLTLQRKMAENIAIAKARETALVKKMKERQKRLEEQAARRFALPTGLSKEEEDLKQIYKKTLDYEMDVNWLQETRQKLSLDPKNPTVVKHSIQSIFRCVDHPLTAVLNKYQQKLCRELLRLTQSRIYELNQIKVPLNQNRGTSFKTLNSEHPQRKDSSAGTNKSVDMNQNISGSPSNEKPALNNTSSVDFSKNKSATDRNNKKIEKQIKDLQLDDKGITPGVPTSSKDDRGTMNLEEIVESTKEKLQTALDRTKVTQEKLAKEQKTAMKIASEITSNDSLKDFDESSDYSLNGSPCSMEDSITLKTEESSEADVSSSDESIIQRSGSTSEELDESTRILQLTDEAYQRHLQNITKDILLYMEKLVKMFIVCYEELGSAEGRDQCYACIEEKFYQSMWPHLFLLFRIVNKDQELAAAQLMTHYQNALPKDVDVALDLCLEQPSNPVDFPYKAAVVELCSVKNYTSPLMKMECLVRVIRQICQCITDYQQSSHSTTITLNAEDYMPVVGADDLLPILHYVLIRSELPQLFSECAAIEELVHEGYLLGEGGYCLTSFRTALEYLVSLAHPNS